MSELSKEKSLLEVFCLQLKDQFGQDYGKIENMTREDREPMERVVEAVAVHARATADKEIEQLKAKLESCPRCEGSGDSHCDADGWHDCLKCHGTGLRKTDDPIKANLKTALSAAMDILNVAGIHTFKLGRDALKQAEAERNQTT